LAPDLIRGSPEESRSGIILVLCAPCCSALWMRSCRHPVVLLGAGQQ